jgi:hypothetical protein
VSSPFTPLTIHGEGFDAPVKVGLAGFVASVLSVSATEIVVVPGNIVANGCSDISGTITVTNINTGETAEGLTFTYQVAASGPVITGVSPAQAQVPGAGLQLLISGRNFPTSAAGVEVTLGGQPVTVALASSTSLTVTIPPTGATAPTCGASDAPGTLLPAGSPLDVTVTNRATTCSATLPGAFQYLLPCAP